MKNHVLMKNSHMLGDDNFYKTEYPKTQIVIGNTFSKEFNHVTKWKTRLNGKYKQTAPLSVMKSGEIYIHFDPKHHSDFMGIDEIDRYIIPIVLENRGWLIKDLHNNVYVDWVGDIYNEDVELVNRRWRSHEYWDPYTEEQLDSLVRLCKYLCERFDIPLEAISNNTKIETIDNFNGVTFRSNYSEYYSDVSPAFDFNGFKNKLELN